jgi:hypothetical protein
MARSIKSSGSNTNAIPEKDYGYQEFFCVRALSGDVGQTG